MSTPLPRPASSGDLVADRRYALAQHYRADGDLAAAADLYAQAAEAAPGWAAAWFALGETCIALGRYAEARAALGRAVAADPDDTLGARLHLARLGDWQETPMGDSYVTALFDQHADAFEASLVGKLGYRGPALLDAAITAACAATGRENGFDRALDLGCGTGLMGAAIHRRVDSLVGIDLSSRMLEHARSKGVYAHLVRADMLDMLRAEHDGAADLIVAADAFVYVRDLAPLFAESARVLEAGGLLAFSTEHLPEGDVELGPSLRFRHSQDHVRAAAAAAGLSLVSLAQVSARQEAGAPVPGLIAVLAKPPVPR